MAVNCYSFIVSSASSIMSGFPKNMLRLQYGSGTPQLAIVVCLNLSHYTTKHKSHIERVMFLCAVARPRYDNHARHVWDGK